MSEIDHSETAVVEQRLFNMQHGPPIPWYLAEALYEIYSDLYGTSQTLQRLHERQGFGWQEIEVICKEYNRKHGHNKAEERVRALLTEDSGEKGSQA
jgi:hypothetical protein